MCGIAGWIDFERNLAQERATAWAMTDTMACRGPDDAGLWTGGHAALGHRRLAVIDPAHGRQPMHSTLPDGTSHVITFSGEIYNFRELRVELESQGHRFRTHCDTEVVLHGYTRWGRELVDRLNGMYAFAVWDEARQELLLVRDRMGVKPLYYHPTATGVLFGSEPKAVLAHPSLRRRVTAEGLCEVLDMVKTPAGPSSPVCARCCRARWSPSGAPVWPAGGTGRSRRGSTPTIWRPPSPRCAAC